jgi:cysteine desulfurase
MPKKYYLDCNAHLPMCEKAQRAYTEYQNSPAGYGHPSSPSFIGRLAATALETSRKRIAELLGAKSPNQIIFTSTCTQACEWGFNIFHSRAQKAGKILKCSPLEHPAIKYILDKTPHSLLNVTNNGVINEITNDDDYVICLHVQNEIGTIQPLENLRGFVFSDMCQSIGKIPVNLSNMNVDLAVFGAHKFGGPASVGILYFKDPSWWIPLGDGSRYFFDRAGTPDVASIVATTAALEDSLDNMSNNINNMNAFQKKIEKIFINNKIEVISNNVRRVPNTTFIKIPKFALNLLVSLFEQEIYVGIGSACGTKHSGPSPLMLAMGKDGGPGDFIRISTHGQYDEHDAEYIGKIIVEKINDIWRKNYVAK